MTGSPKRVLAGLTAALLLGAGGAARAAGSLAIDAALDKDQIVAGGDAATLTVAVRTTGLKLPGVPTPNVPGLLFQPAGTAQNFSMINGGISRSVTAEFLVRAARPGVYTIGPLSVALGKDHAETKPLTLTVLKAGASVPAPRQGAAEPWSGSRGGPPEVFARLTVDRSRVLWNQQITAHLRVYARVTIEGAPDYKPPETPGFWVEELGQPHLERASVGGVDYAVNDIEFALFPTRSGRLTIGSARIQCRIQRVVEERDPLGLLNLQQVVPQDVTVQTEPVAITVDPLPPGAPPGFSGAVGSFDLGVRVDRLDVEAGDPVTVTAIVRGAGNIASLRDPSIMGPEGVRRYAAGSSTSTDRSGERLRGERSEQVAFLPDSPGELRIEPVHFAWFDPEAGQYRSARSDTIRVRIHPAAPGARKSALPIAAGPVAAPRGRPGPFGSLGLGPPAGSVGLGAAALAGLALAWSVARRREKHRLDPRALRAAGLDRLLSRDLKEARSRLAARRLDAAAALAGEALLHGVALRFGVPRSGETRRELLDAARQRGASAEDVARIGALLAALEALAYAPPETRPGTAAREIESIGKLLLRFRRELS